MGNNLSKVFSRDGFKQLDFRLKVVFFTTLIGGLLTYAMVMFNEYAIGDNTMYMFGIGGTVESGR